MDLFAPTGQQLAQLRGTSLLGDVVQLGSSSLLTAIDNTDGLPVVVRYRIVR